MLSVGLLSPPPQPKSRMIRFDQTACSCETANAKKSGAHCAPLSLSLQIQIRRSQTLILIFIKSPFFLLLEPDFFSASRTRRSPQTIEKAKFFQHSLIENHSMFGTLTFLTGTSPQFLPGNSFSAAGVSTSGSHSKMPFAARNPSGNGKVQAIAGTAARVKSTKPANLYQILRITETASPIEIKTAYRSLAKVYHPDASSESSDCGDFIEIHNAYATLSDPTARARYDLAIGARTRFRYSAGIRPHFGQTMRWETDQCW